MTLLRESLLYHILLTLWTSYENSAIHRFAMGLGGWFVRQTKESRLLRPLLREGAVARAWETSLLYRLLTFLINLPGELLHALYRRFRPVFETSVFSRAVFTLGETTALTQFWLIALMWSIPFASWNNAYSLLAFAFLLVLFHAGAMRRKELRLDLAAIGFYPLAIFGAAFVAAAVSYAPNQSLRFLGFHASAALCVLVTVSAVRNQGDLKRLAAGAAVCVTTSSLYAILQRAQGLEVNRSFVDLSSNPDMPGRVFSFFDNPNTFAEVLILLLPLVLALILGSKSWLGKLAACCAFGVGVVALGMTYSRASWLGFAVALVVMILLWKPRLLPAFLVVCCLAIPLLPSTIWTRILSITNMSDTTTSSRFPLYMAALEVIRKSPFAGAGLGVDAVKSYIADYNLYHGTAPFVHAHNFYLQVWLEAGLLGIVSLVAALLWNIKRAARAARHTQTPAVRAVTCGAAAALCGIMVSGMADYPWNYPRVMCIFWFTFAVALAGVKLSRQTEEKTP